MVLARSLLWIYLDTQRTEPDKGFAYETKHMLRALSQQSLECVRKIVLICRNVSRGSSDYQIRLGDAF